MISARKAKQLDATTMFTCTHANTPLGQSERVYYLSYFIKLVPTRTLLYSLYATLYKIDITIRQALGDIPKVFVLQRVDCTYYFNL